MQPTTDTRPASPLMIVGIFVGTFAVLTILLALLQLFLEFENSAMGILIVFGSALQTAQFWFKREGAIPASGRAWGYALICGLIAGVLSAGLTMLALSGDAQLWNEFAASDLQTKALLFGGIAVALVLVVRLGFWLGFWQSAKAARKAKGA